MARTFILRLFALGLVTSTVTMACGTDQYVVAVVHSGGSAGSVTTLTGGSSLGGYTVVVTSVGNMNGGNGNTLVSGGTSAASASIGGGVSSTSETGGTSQSVSGVPAEGGISGDGGVVITLNVGGNSTTWNVTGGGTGGIGSTDTQLTSLGGSDGSTSTITTFASDSCICQMNTAPQCEPDGVTGDQICTFDCVLWPDACDQGCPCTETTQLSYSLGDGALAMSCSAPEACDSTMGCTVEFSKFSPHQVRRSSCIVLVSLP